MAKVPYPGTPTSKSGWFLRRHFVWHPPSIKSVNAGTKATKQGVSRLFVLAQLLKSASTYAATRWYSSLFALALFLIPGKILKRINLPAVHVQPDFKVQVMPGAASGIRVFAAASLIGNHIALLYGVADFCCNG